MVTHEVAALTTQRLRLRRSRPEDAEAISAYRSDPEVQRYQGWEHTDPDSVSDQIIEMAERVPGRDGWIQFTVFEIESGALIGDVGMCPSSSDEGVIKVGYTIAPAFQRRGYGTEALAALIDFIFANTDATTVRAYADADNLPSIRVAERAGMVHQETFVEVEDGERWTGVRYERRRGPGDPHP
jgi:aminoglycoside 6'-N-acetyltransferase